MYSRRDFYYYSELAVIFKASPNIIKLASQPPSPPKKRNLESSSLGMQGFIKKIWRNSNPNFQSRPNPKDLQLYKNTKRVFDLWKTIIYMSFQNLLCFWETLQTFFCFKTLELFSIKTLRKKEKKPDVIPTKTVLWMN